MTGARRCKDQAAGRPLRSVSVLIAVLVCLAAFVPDASARPLLGGQAADPDPPAVAAARLAVRIDTTSDWTRVRIVPGQLEAQRVVARSPDVTLKRLSDGWLLRQPGDSGRVELDVLFSELNGADGLRIEIEKGYQGATTLELVNGNAAGQPAVRKVNDRRSLLDSSNTVRWTVPRAEILGDAPLQMPHADDRDLVLAFYYPWFHTYDDPRLRDRPSRPRSTFERPEVASMLQQARAHGVDGFVVSWAGDRANGPAFDLVVRASEDQGGPVTGYLETLRARRWDGSIDVAQLRRWLRELLDRSDSPAFLRADGIPVVFVWQMGEVPADEWQDILDGLADEGRPVRIVGDAWSERYAEVSWGLHRYGPTGSFAGRAKATRRASLNARAGSVLDPTVAPRLVVGGVAPGYEDGRLLFSGSVDRGSQGQRYGATWDAALLGDPDWIAVTSWNEWYEATSIEPSTSYGSRALQQTANRAEAWRSTAG